MMEFLFEKYLLQNRYDETTNMFYNGIITLHDYQIFIEYYENQATIKLFTVNLN